MKCRLLVIFVVFVALLNFVCADGMIIPVPPRERPHIPPLTVKYHHVNIKIEDQYAGTNIDQVFKNDFQRDLEGTYIFPLSNEASITSFSMFVDGERLEGKILEKDKARKIYEDIVRQLRDPAILEYVDRNMFQARVYPIPAMGEKRIQLKYSEVIRCDSGICKYVYPLEMEKFSPKPLGEVVISVNINSKQPIKSVYSPTHSIEVDRIDDHNVEVSYEANDVKPTKDFELYYTVSEKDFGLNLLTFREKDKDGFFMLMVSPKQEIEKDEIIPKDIVFVLDRSGSMSGEKIEQAKNALKFCINNLNREDKFNLITFSSDVDKFADEMLQSEKGNVNDALDFISGITATGGTNIHDALLEALELFSDSGRAKSIVFLTDGKPTVGTTNIEKIQDAVKDDNEEDIRIFVFGVGYDVNTHLLDKLSDQNNGASEYVRPEEDIEVKVSNFYTRISNPVLSDVEIKIPKVRADEIFPVRLPDLFKGSQLIVLGRYEDGGDSLIELTGTVGKETKAHTYEVTFPAVDEDNEFIPRIWATKKIGYLLDEIRLHGEDEELIDEIIDLSLEYGIMTPYTSFLVDMDTDGGVRPPMEEARKAFSRVLSAEGMYDTSGQNAVAGAQAVQKLQDAETAHVETEKIQVVGTKTFYNKDGIWTDNSYTQQRTTDIAYESDAYFKLVGNYPGVGKYLAVGKNVTFCVENKCFKIGETGKTDVTDKEIQIPTTIKEITSLRAVPTTLPPHSDEEAPIGALLVVGLILVLIVVTVLRKR